MIEDLKALIIDQLPVIVAAVGGFLVGLFTYLAKRVKYKRALVEKETANIELQQVIARGSYILCPNCGEKIFLTDVKVFTGGVKDEK